MAKLLENRGDPDQTPHSVHNKTFTLLLGVIGRLCSVIGVLPGHLLCCLVITVIKVLTALLGLLSLSVA